MQGPGKWGEINMVFPVTCIFHIFQALNYAFEAHFFSWLHLYMLSKTLVACRAMQLRISKVETLLYTCNALRSLIFKHED